MTYASIVSLLKTALLLLSLAQGPNVPQSLHDQAVKVSNQAIAAATQALAKDNASGAVTSSFSAAATNTAGQGGGPSGGGGDASSPHCVPMQPETQTLSCPAGQSGLISQSRQSICPAGASTPIWEAWVTTASTCAPTFSLDYQKSGETYSDITGMFRHQSGQLWSLDSSTTPGVFVHQDVWSNEGNVAHAHLGEDQFVWSNISKRNYEEFIVQNGWVVQSGWTTWGEQGFYKRVSKKVTFTWEPGTAQAVTYDLTDTFKGNPPPYVLEQIPAKKYEIRVESELINTADGKKIYDEVDDQIWDPPAQVETVFFGTRVGIVQHEWYTATWPSGDPRGIQNTHRDHTMAKGVGYGARIYDYGNGGWVAGEKYLWNW